MTGCTMVSRKTLKRVNENLQRGAYWWYPQAIMGYRQGTDSDDDGDDDLQPLDLMSVEEFFSHC